MRPASYRKSYSCRKFLRLRDSNHISGNRRLNNLMEAELLNARKNLTHLNARKLAGNRRCNHRIDMIAGIIPGIPQQIQYIDNK